MAASVTRAERAAEAARLYAGGPEAGGLTQQQVADVMGLSRSYVAELITDPAGEKCRARKDSYRGTCVICGARTYGGDGPSRAPRYCHKHVRLDPDWLEAHTKWPADRIIAAIQCWNAKYGEPPAGADWNPWQCANEYGDAARARRAERLIVQGRVPWFSLVYDRFGTWNAAIAAAGLEPRATNGGGGNQQRRRSVRAKAKAAA